MDRNRVAAHYRGKGYTVHENLRVAGSSGNEYVLDMLAEGPLGNLLVSFGDAAGLDGPEMGSARRIAKDIGATPVLAGDQFAEGYRLTATRLGVVILDADSLQDQGRAGPRPEWPPGIASVTPTAGDTMRADLSAHPWPASGRGGAAKPEGPKRARDVDELLADLQEPPEPERRNEAASQSELWKGPGQQEGPNPAASGSSSAKFAWLRPAGYDPSAEPAPSQASSSSSTSPASSASPASAATAGGPVLIGQGVEPDLSTPEAGGLDSDLIRTAHRRRMVRRAIKWGVALLLVYLFFR